MEANDSHVPEVDEFYVLKNGDIEGPFTKADLEVRIEEGRFLPSDFVQAGGLPIWRPISRVFGTQEDPLHGAVAPDWRSIVTWAWLRLRYNLDEQSVEAGLSTLGVAILAVLLGRWPFFFWLPWLVLTAIAGFALLRRGRSLAGFLLLIAVIAVPIIGGLLGRHEAIGGAGEESRSPESLSATPIPGKAP